MKSKFTVWLVLLVMGCTLFSISVVAQSTQYELLEPLPGTHDGGSTTAGKYIPGIVKFVIGAAGVLAVLKIMYGGVLYMSTDAIGGKSEAKGHIQNALWGLLLIVSSYLILHTINPRLVEIDLTISGVDTGTPFNDEEIENPYDDIDPGDWSAGCFNCTLMNNSIYYSKPVGTGCARTNPLNNATSTGNICLVNRSLDAALSRLTAELAKEVEVPNTVGVNPIIYIPREDWWVTEGYPPTVPHESQCHKPLNPPSAAGGGTCVDLAFQRPPTDEIGALGIWRLIRAALASNITTLIYEVPSDARREAILDTLDRIDGDLRNDVDEIIRNTGAPEHLHAKIIP